MVYGTFVDWYLDSEDGLEEGWNDGFLDGCLDGYAVRKYLG